MVNEQLHSGPNLLERISPVLTQVRELSGNKVAQQAVARSWFKEHSENLARDLEDLASICTLPREERILLAGPLVGNWFMDRMASIVPQTSSQSAVLQRLTEYIEIERLLVVSDVDFQAPREDSDDRNKKFDALEAAMLEDSVGGRAIVGVLGNHYEKFIEDMYQLPRLDAYTVDLGHGLGVYAMLVCRPAIELVEYHEKPREPLNVSVMIVDDQHPEDWYNRMIAQGFKNVPEQQGFFFDCESALTALQNGNYDVILTDLDLGEGKMDGITFAEQAYEIQTGKGIPPRISVFSYDDARLAEAQKRLGGSNDATPKIFRNYYKAIFKAFDFRRDVDSLLHSERRIGQS